MLYVCIVAEHMSSLQKIKSQLFLIIDAANMTRKISELLTYYLLENTNDFLILFTGHVHSCCMNCYWTAVAKLVVIFVGLAAQKFMVFTCGWMCNAMA